jgi:hypothetical protein
MGELKKNLVELQKLLDSQNSSIVVFIETVIDKLDNNDFSCLDDIINAAKIQDFMNKKAAFLFNNILDLVYKLKRER